jgi:8-oxo-dGTP pyrophosphatase MutT (NUDIX family)
VQGNPSEFSCETVIRGETYRRTWLGLADVVALRVRGFTFTEPGKLLLVRGDDGFQIPGGGVESGESVVAALRRELMEEAGATIVRSRRLGAFGIDGVTKEFSDLHDFYWCQVTLALDWIPPFDISERVVVRAEDFLDTLPWGRTDSSAEFLLARALAVDTSAWKPSRSL